MICKKGSTARSSRQLNTVCPLCRSRSTGWAGKLPRKGWGCAKSATESCQLRAERKDQSMKLRPDTATRCAAIATILIAALTAGCSSSSDATTTTSSTSGSTTASVSSSSSATVSPSTSDIGSTSAPSTATPTTSTSPPWPADFTPEQQADAQAAIDAFQEAQRVTDEAYSNPGRADIEAFVRQSIADPRADQVIRAAAAMVAAGQHSTGYSQATVRASSTEGSRVSLEICLDSSQTDLLDQQGNSIKAKLPVGDRIKQSANVYHYSSAGDRWLLSELTAPQPYEPC